MPSSRIKWMQPVAVSRHVPQRWFVSYFGFLAIVNAFAMRLCLDMMLPEIVGRQVVETAPVANKTLPRIHRTRRNFTMRSFNITKHLLHARNVSKRIEPAAQNIVKKSTFAWSDQLQTMVLISFYVGYVVAHIPSAHLAEKYGGKWVLGIGLLLTALLTICTPMAIGYGGPLALIGMRLLIGLCEAPTFPALSSLLAQWVPAKERGTLGVLVLSGGQMGIFFASLFSSLMLQKFNWPLIFYFFGGCALLWFIGFCLMCYNDPPSNPFIEDSEKLYLEKEITQEYTKAESGVPWSDILSNIPMWGLTLATIQHDWSQNRHIANIPKFIQDMKGKSMRECFFSSLCESSPYIWNWIVSLTSGFLSDILVNREILTATTTRKVMSAVAAGPSILFNIASCVSCNEHVSFFSVCNCALCAMAGTYYAGSRLTTLDMSHNYAGTLMGIANGIGSTTNIVTPFFKDFMEQSSMNKLRGIMWLASTMLLSAEVQPFDNAVSSLNKNK